MPRVDFYILTDGTHVDRFACSIASKAWLKGNRVHMHMSSENSAVAMDNLLWTFRDISFVPHELFDGSQSEETPITVGYGTSFPEHSQVVINLDTDVPEFVPSFERVVEIVGGDENNKQYARQRYRYYKDNAYEIHDHKIDGHSLND